MNNTTDSLAVLDPPAMPLASREPAAEPTIGMILQSAVERGMDPAGMEKLAAIYERELSRRAEREFIEALASFRRECPPIMKVKTADVQTKSGGKMHYNFAPLEEITKVVDGPLLRNGLTYTWDQELSDGLVVVTCTLSHEGGHKRSSKFTCQASGTSVMSPAQVQASAVTFGRRYSLTGVLKPLRVGSFCSGIAAPETAWRSLGWKPVFFSEIDPFASAVLAHRYPGVPNLGDMEKISAETLRRLPR
jgi:hypothetical protein